MAYRRHVMADFGLGCQHLCIVAEHPQPSGNRAGGRLEALSSAPHNTMYVPYRWLSVTPRLCSAARSPGTLQDLRRQGDHHVAGQAHPGGAQAVDRPRAVRLVDDQQGVVAVVVGAVALRRQAAALALRVEYLGYVDHVIIMTAITR